MVGWPRLRFIGPNEKPPRWQRASKKIQSFDHRQVVDLDYLLWLRSFTYSWSPTGATQLGRPFENVIDLDWTQVIGAQVAHGMKLSMSLYLFNWKTTRSTSTNALLLCSWIRRSKKCNAAKSHCSVTKIYPTGSIHLNEQRFLNCCISQWQSISTSPGGLVPYKLMLLRWSFNQKTKSVE